MDIALIFDNAKNYADIEIENGDLKKNHDLESSVILSTFANRLAQIGDNFEKDRKGWWGDTYGEVIGSLLGSRLWLLQRAKATNATAALAKDYVEEALAWIIEDQIAERIDVETEIHPLHTLAIGITLYRPRGNVTTFKYNYVWSQF